MAEPAAQRRPVDVRAGRRGFGLSGLLGLSRLGYLTRLNRVDRVDEPLRDSFLDPDRSEPAVECRHGRATVEVGEPLRHSVDVACRQAALGQHVAPQRAVRETTHAHRGMKHLPRPTKPRTLRAVANVHHTEVERASQASVQAQFFFTVVASRSQCREVEEGQPHRFFSL